MQEIHTSGLKVEGDNNFLLPLQALDNDDLAATASANSVEVNTQHHNIHTPPPYRVTLCLCKRSSSTENCYQHI